MTLHVCLYKCSTNTYTCTYTRTYACTVRTYACTFIIHAQTLSRSLLRKGPMQHYYFHSTKGEWHHYSTQERWMWWLETRSQGSYLLCHCAFKPPPITVSLYTALASKRSRYSCRAAKKAKLKPLETHLHGVLRQLTFRAGYPSSRAGSNSRWWSKISYKLKST